MREIAYPNKIKDFVASKFLIQLHFEAFSAAVISITKIITKMTTTTR